MTPNIQQHVTPRHKKRLYDRGSISHATITAGFGIVALILVASLGFFYLQQVLGTATQGTDIAELEGQLVELKQKHRQLELEGARLRSLQTVESRIQKLNLVSTNQVSYLTDPSEQVAVLP